MLVTQLSQTLHIAVRRNEDAVGSNNGLDDYGCDRLWAFELEDLLGPGQYFLSRVRALLNAVVEIGNTEDAGDARLRGPAARITS